MAGFSEHRATEFQKLERYYTDHLTNRVKLANHYSTHCYQVPEAMQTSVGKHYFGLSCVVCYAGTAVYHYGQGTRLCGLSCTTLKMISFS